MFRTFLSTSLKLRSKNLSYQLIYKNPLQFQQICSIPHAQFSNQEAKHESHHHIKLPFRHGDWLHPDHRVVKKYVRKLVAEREPDPSKWTDVVKEFRAIIENDPVVYMLFSSMFTEVPVRPPFNKNIFGGPEVTNYMEFLGVLNTILTRAPEFIDNESAGVPLFAVLDWPMGTRSGYYAFINEKVNAQLKKVLNEWGEFLKSRDSTYVLNTEDGWFSKTALKELAEAADEESRGFQELFICDPNKPSWGFTSWDSFFTRLFRPEARPLPKEDPYDIVNACESTAYRNPVANIKDLDIFWIKRQPYSLRHILDGEMVEEFVGGTVYQAYLSAKNYHRWHSPVNGKIVAARVVDGTYYAEVSAFGFDPNVNSTLTDSNMKAPHQKEQKSDDSHKPVSKDESFVEQVENAMNDSQAYISQLATRALIFIESDNPDIGLMCFVGIGMIEVSTCDITVKVGQHVKKGEELGMFHFGGSSHLLIFRPGVEVDFHFNNTNRPGAENQEAIKINSKLATVKPNNNKKS